MGWYYDAKPTIERADGIKAKSKRGDFTKNWWADRWIKNMEQVMDRGRLQRGRRYARKGQVIGLEESAGGIKARVQGSSRRPYKISLEITLLSEEAWQQVVEALIERPLFIAQLLAGEMPATIEDAFAAAKVRLYPAGYELVQKCSCPDYATVCKHVAAVHYILAERFDEDPFLLFKLRGKTKDEIMQVLTPYHQAATDETETISWDNPPLEDQIDTYWASETEGIALGLDLNTPSPAEMPVLTRLGAPDFLPNLSQWLNPIGQSVAKQAHNLLLDSGQTADSTSINQTDDE